MLAQMHPSQVAALFPGPEAFTVRNDNGPQSLPALQDLLSRARALGYAWEQDEITEGFSSVAVAVLDRARYPVASVTCTNRAFPARGARRATDAETAEERALRIEDVAREWVPDVTRCAREISRRLGIHT